MNANNANLHKKFDLCTLVNKKEEFQSHLLTFIPTNIEKSVNNIILMAFHYAGLFYIRQVYLLYLIFFNRDWYIWSARNVSI